MVSNQLKRDLKRVVNNKPLVSIGMPIYNAGELLFSAFDSLLAQDYANFEIIISDNHSTDNTRAICLDYVERDKRIRYYRSDRNDGAIKNFNRVFKLSRGKYFIWQAHDDCREPSYISSCLEIMEKNPAVILCCSSALLDEEGNLSQLKEDFGTVGMSPNDRFRKILWNNSCASIYGLIRSRVLKKTGLLRNVFGPDNLLLAELSLMGEFFQLPLVLFKISVRSGSIMQKVKAVFEGILPNDPYASFFPFTKLAIEHWKLIQKSDLRGKERFHAFWDIVFCFFLKYKTFLLDPAMTTYLNLMKLRRSLLQ